MRAVAGIWAIVVFGGCINIPELESGDAAMIDRDLGADAGVGIDRDASGSGDAIAPPFDAAARLRSRFASASH